MESSNQGDYSLNSLVGQEVDQQDQEQEQEYYMGGVGRFYECVFCKRGFNTAQALGGHMNIHRKDKLPTRNKPSTTSHNLLSSNINKKHEIHSSLSSDANLRYYNVAEAQSNYLTHFSESTSTSTSSQIFLNHNKVSSSHDDHHNIPCLNLFGDDWDKNLSLQFGTTAAHVIDTMKNKGQEDDLDLELRLGHDPLKQ